MVNILILLNSADSQIENVSVPSNTSRRMHRKQKWLALERIASLDERETIHCSFFFLLTTSLFWTLYCTPFLSLFHSQINKPWFTNSLLPSIVFMSGWLLLMPCSPHENLTNQVLEELIFHIFYFSYCLTRLCLVVLTSTHIFTYAKNVPLYLETC